MLVWRKNNTASGAACLHAVSEVGRVMGLPPLLGEEQTGQERTGEKKHNEMKITVAAVQITYPKGFDFSNMAES